MSDGRFITFEGGDGVGKTTQIALVADRLDAAGQGSLITREPGGTPFVERLRELILARETPQRSALSEADAAASPGTTLPAASLTLP